MSITSYKHVFALCQHCTLQSAYKENAFLSCVDTKGYIILSNTASPSSFLWSLTLCFFFFSIWSSTLLTSGQHSSMQWELMLVNVMAVTTPTHCTLNITVLLYKYLACLKQKPHAQESKMKQLKLNNWNLLQAPWWLQGSKPLVDLGWLCHHPLYTMTHWV